MEKDHFHATGLAGKILTCGKDAVQSLLRQINPLPLMIWRTHGTVLGNPLENWQFADEASMEAIR
jgi:hypothetical protein